MKNADCCRVKAARVRAEVQRWFLVCYDARSFRLAIRGEYEAKYPSRRGEFRARSGFLFCVVKLRRSPS
jgi:hypothetical protein